MSKFDVNVGVNLHNRFDIEVKDIRTGKIRQRAQAFNIILNQMWVRLCNGTEWFRAIAFGSGTGTLDVARTDLFNRISQKAATIVEQIVADPVSSIKKSIILNPAEFVDSTITEIGILHTNASGANAVTHAMLVDIEGNSISITKTATDIITIYATVFSTYSKPANCFWTSLRLGFNTEINSLFSYLTDGSNTLSLNYVYWYLGSSSLPGGSYYPSTLQRNKPTHGINFGFASKSTGGTGPINDVPNKKRTIATTRFEVTEGNGPIVEIAARHYFRFVIPISTFLGQPYVGVPIGIGDGIQTKYTLPSKDIDLTSLSIKINGSITEDYEAYKKIGTLDGVVHGVVPASSSVSNDWGSADGSLNRGIFYKHGSGVGTDYTLETFEKAPDDIIYIKKFTQTSVLPDRSVSGVISKNGNRIFMTQINTFIIYVCDYTSTGWVLHSTITVPNNTGKRVAPNYDGSKVAVIRYSGSTYRISNYYWNGEIWEEETYIEGTRAGLALNYDLEYGLMWCNNYSTLYLTGSYFASSTPVTLFMLIIDLIDGAFIVRPSIELSFSHDQKYLLSEDGSTLIIYKHSLATLYVYTWDGTTWISKATINSIVGDKKIFINSDGTKIAIVTQQDVRIFIWNNLLETWESTGIVGYMVDNSAYVGSHFRSMVANDDLSLIVTIGYYYASSGTSGRYFDGNMLIIEPRTTEIDFTTPPDEGDILTADYTVAGIHKTDQYVLDVKSTIQFGEGEAPE